MDLIRFRILVNGLVQGVGFRYYTLRIAEQFGATGFVKNNYDGSVSIEIQSKLSIINNILSEIKRGPSHSFVREFQKIEIEVVIDEIGFKIIK